MRVGSDAKSLVFPQFSGAQSAMQRKDKHAPAAELLGSAPLGDAPNATAGNPAAVDFTRMTRQEMFDWVNEQIRGGAMSLDESTPFIGMTLKISVETGQSVDLATDTERVDFIEKARRGIEGALWRRNYDEADRLRGAVATMERLQDAAPGIDLIA